MSGNTGVNRQKMQTEIDKGDNQSEGHGTHPLHSQARGLDRLPGWGVCDLGPVAGAGGFPGGWGKMVVRG